MKPVLVILEHKETTCCNSMGYNCKRLNYNDCG